MNVQVTIGGVTATVTVTAHEVFQECIELRESPFYNMQVVLPSGIDAERHRQLVIKCIIPDEFHLPILQRNLSGQDFCYDARDRVLQSTYPDARLILYQSRHCNHFENQFKYLFH